MLLINTKRNLYAINKFKKNFFRWAGVALWNNLLEKPGTKSMNWISPKKRFHCPTENNPYFYTNDNYKEDRGDSIKNSIVEKQHKFFNTEMYVFVSAKINKPCFVKNQFEKREEKNKNCCYYIL